MTTFAIAALLLIMIPGPDQALITRNALVAGRRGGLLTVSSEELAAAAGVNSAKLRKDLSYLGSYGIRGVGYDVGTLSDEIARTLEHAVKTHIGKIYDKLGAHNRASAVIAAVRLGLVADVERTS